MADIRNVAEDNPYLVIAQALFDFSGSGQGVDDILQEIVQHQVEAIKNALKAAGFKIVRINND